MKGKTKKILAFMLAMMMIVSLMPNSVYADDSATPSDAITEEQTTEDLTENSTVEDITTEENTEASTQTVDPEENNDSETAEEEETVDENLVVFDHMYSDIDTSNINTTELFVQTDDASVFTKNTNVVSNYDNVYIISCETLEEARYVYSYYIDKVDYITDLQNTIELQETEETEDVADLSDVNTESEDAIANLEETKSETEEALDTVKDKNYSEYIALIDSGIDESVLGDNDISVSVLGDDLKDNVGHGTKMYNYIKEENPNAKILSIKAFDKNTSDVASIYAAIKLAIESKVSVINLSFVAMNTENNQILKDIIQEAIDNNITVIGAAGNYETSATNYIPGCIDDVITVGAVNEDGTLYKTSNYDADLYVVASSTSEATAKYSGIYTSGNKSDKVYTELKTNVQETLDTTKENTQETNETETSQNINNNEAQLQDSGANPNDWYNGWINSQTSFPNKIVMSTTINGNNGASTSISNLNVNTGNPSGAMPSGWDWCKYNDWPTPPYSIANIKSWFKSCFDHGAIWYESTSPFDWGTNSHNKYYWWSCVNHSNASPYGNTDYMNIGYVKLADKVDGKYEYAVYGGLWESDSAHQSIALVCGFYRERPWYYGVGYQKIDADTERAVPGCTLSVYTSDKSTKLGTMTDAGGGKYYWTTGPTKNDYGSQVWIYENSASGKYNNSKNNGRWLKKVDLQWDYSPVSVSYPNANVSTQTPWHYGVALKKVDPNNGDQPLSGGVFRITAKYSDNSTETHTVTTDNSGQAAVELTYKSDTAPTVTAVETTPPDNYIVNSNTITLSVTKTTDDISYSTVTNKSVIPEIHKKELRVRKLLNTPNSYTGTVTINVYKTLADAQNNTNIKKTYTANLNGSWTSYQNVTDIIDKENITNGQKLKDTTLYLREVSCTNSKIRMNPTIKSITISGSTAASTSNQISFESIKNDAEVPIKLKKVSSNPDCTDGNPNYDLAGATYKLFDTQAKAQAALTSRNFNEAIGTFTVQNNTTGETNTIDITNINGVNYLRPNGAEYNQQRTFYLVESTPGTGYLNNSNIITITVPANLPSGKEYMEYSVKDEPVNDPIVFVLDKHDDAVNEDLVDEEQKAKNLAALVGTEFTINYYAESIIEGNFLTKDDLLRLTPTRTETAVAEYNESTGQVEASFDLTADPFPRGYIVIKEITPTSNYTTDGMKIILNNVDITGKEVLLSDFKYRDATQTTYKAVTYYPGSAKNYSELLDSNGNPNTSKGVMAMYANEASGSVSITPKVTNKPIRGDVDWEKYFIETVESEEEKPMANVKFSITNKDTGEKHYFYTGADGKANTSTTEYKPDIINYYDNVNDYDGTASYVWFEKAYNSENDSTTIHPYNEYTAANYGSLPYGTYIIKEEACAANEGHQLEPAHEFIITKQGVTVRVWDRESEQRTHNIYNVKKPTIKTTAKSTVTQEHFMIQSKEYVDYANQTINDVVDYTKLRANSNYTLVAKLMILSQDGSVRPYKEVVDGQERDYVRLHTFKTKETYLKTIYEVDGSETVVLDKVDPSGLEEKQEKLVVYEYLYYQIIENVDDIPTDEAALQYPGYVEKDGMWFFPLKHDNPLDTAQTVTIPDIHTTIKDSVSEDHIAHTSAQTTLVDRVYYTGLEVGKPYKMTGTLQVKEGTDWSHVKYDPADPNADEDGYVYDTTDTTEPTVENPDAQTPDGQGNTTTEPSNGTDGQTTDGQTTTDGQNTDDQTNDDTNTTDNTNTETTPTTGEQTDANTIVMDRVYTLRDAEGNVIQAEPVEFVPETSEGYVDIVFTFDSTALEGKSVVAFEECWYNDLVVSVHHDLNDEDETIHFPKFVTTSRNSLIESYTNIKEDEEETAKQVPAENLNGESFTDTIHFTNLIANRTYKVVGTLMDSETGEVLKDASGKEITAERTFNTAEMEAVEITVTPDAFNFTTADGEVLDLASDHANYLVNGDIDLPFEGFDFSNLDGKTGVVFEKAYLVKEATVTAEDGTETKETKDISIGEHEDLKDTKQFIYFAEGHTNATDLTTQTKVVPQDVETTIEDIFTYKNLIPGKTYKIEASLRAYGDKSGTYKDGDILKDKDGKDIIVVIDDFVPEKSDGEYKINIPFNTTALRGMEVVVFEDVYNNYGLNVLTHHDIEDRDQTVEIPDGRTTVVDSENKEHVVFADKEVTVIDTITYENLYPGVEYTATGVLMDKATGKELIVDGKKITNTVKFTPTEKNGTVEVPFTFNATGLENKKIVVFENVKVQPSDVDVIIHHDINDVDQTFNIPEGSTTAMDKDTKDKVVSYGEEITIVDTITYKNLVPGIEYEATGTLMDKKTGKEIEVDGKPVTNTVKFTPKEEDGTVEVPFTFNSTTLEDKVIVVFEDVKVNGKTVLIHQDLEDEDQTVYVPKLRTTATVDSGKKEVKANAETVLIDKVEYTNLVVGKEYTVKGVLMDKSTGKELIIDGKTITAEKTFKADKADGYVELEFKFNSSKLGTDIVVFEDLYHENVKVATHSDITDKDQTITIIPESPKTGDSKRFPVEIPVVIALSLIGLGFVVVKRRKKN